MRIYIIPTSRLTLIYIYTWMSGIKNCTMHIDVHYNPILTFEVFSAGGKCLWSNRRVLCSGKGASSTGRATKSRGNSSHDQTGRLSDLTWFGFIHIYMVHVYMFEPSALHMLHASVPQHFHCVQLPSHVLYIWLKFMESVCTYMYTLTYRLWLFDATHLYIYLK